MDLLYRQHFERIRREIARSFGCGPPDPEEAVQAAFERYAAIDDKSEIDNPHGFLVTSARNFMIDQRRRQRVRLSYSESVRSINNDSDECDAERVLEGKERLRILDHAIGGMDGRLQEVLILNRIHGLNCAEIARRNGCSATLVKKHLAQALQICERALREADEQ